MSSGYFDVPRRSELWFNLPQTTLARKSWHQQKSARDIKPQRVQYTELAGGLYNSGHALLIAGDAWIIAPMGHDPVELLTTEGQSHVEAVDVNLAPNHRSYYTYRRTPTPGAGQASNLLMQAAPAFQRRRAAGSLLSTGSLDADLVALPAPLDPGHGPLGEHLIPSDRVLSGVVTYPANTPYLLGFQAVTGAQEQTCCFYFGGAAEVLPHGESGGQFSLTLRGDGRAILREFDQEVYSAGVGDPWKPVYEFVWKHQHLAGNFPGLVENNTLYVVPYGRDRMAFYNLGAGYANGGNASGPLGLMIQNALQFISAQEARQPISIRLLRHGIRADDHRHLSYMTGAGTIRMDRSRTDRLPFQICHLHYRTAATLIDAAFFIDVGVIPLASHLTVGLDAYTPAGTSIDAEVFDATTNVRLLRSGLVWLTNAGQNRYYVKFTLRSDGDPDAVPPVAAGQDTPVLFGYTIELPPAFADVAAAPTKTARIKTLSVTGPGVMLIEESAYLQLQDEIDEASLLRRRDQMRTKVVIVNRATSDPISVLFEGQTAAPEAELRGFQDGEAYPSAHWHDYECRLAGLWPRLFRQFHGGPMFSFADSLTSPHPVEGQPWRLTDALRWTLNQAGVPNAQIDIPDSPLRFPAEAGLKPESYAIQAGVVYGRLAEELTKDFLGQILVRDPNCGAIDSSGLPTGMWRLLLNPATSSTNYLFTINLDKPVDTGTPRLPMTEGGMGTEVYPVRAGTWKTHPRAPEANVVVCRGFSDGGSDNGHNLLTTDPLVNLSSFDPASPDYLEGDTVHVVKVFEGFAMTMPMLNWCAHILYQRVAFGEIWFQCMIPCPLIFDPLDVPGPQVLPRPPRINDLCLVRYEGTDYPAVIRSANPIWQRDDWPWIHLEGKFRDPAFTTVS